MAKSLNGLFLASSPADWVAPACGFTTPGIALKEQEKKAKGKEKKQEKKENKEKQVAMKKEEEKEDAWPARKEEGQTP